MLVEVTDQYLIMMAISFLFTVLSVLFREKIVLTLLAGICWLISSLANFAVGDQTSPLTSALSLLFLAFGIIFVVKTVINIAHMRYEKRYGIGL